MILRITAYLRPHKLEEVKTAVSNLDIGGLTVSDVRGCGASPELPSSFVGQEVLIALPVRSKLEVVVPERLKDEVVEAVLKTARTGSPGDGKVFVEEVLDVVRIRTGERGQDAV